MFVASSSTDSVINDREQNDWLVDLRICMTARRVAPSGGDAELKVLWLEQKRKEKDERTRRRRSLEREPPELRKPEPVSDEEVSALEKKKWLERKRKENEECLKRLQG